MFAAELAERRMAGYKISHLRTGIAAGAPVPLQLMEDLRAEFDLQELTNTYGTIFRSVVLPLRRC
jgi:acyl-CoA synthetase (AMP-forming)/AMP-acid ligase II